VLPVAVTTIVPEPWACELKAQDSAGWLLCWPETDAGTIPQPQGARPAAAAEAAITERFKTSPSGRMACLCLTHSNR
jgi:hypothetical protein